MADQPESKSDRVPGCFLSVWGIGGAVIGLIVGLARNSHQEDMARLIGAVLWNITLCMGIAVFIGWVVSSHRGPPKLPPLK